MTFDYGDGGVYVSEQPHLTFLADTDGDDRAEERQGGNGGGSGNYLGWGGNYTNYGAGGTGSGGSDYGYSAGLQGVVCINGYW